ncbi:tyrosinase cofactor [Kitasatospora sp. NBC_01250]|uniref:apotyrosinase chaperone MelC1 n=1 Tax=unclassified Kitasatospora TaxID=2633591 RepID=UPI002E153B3B|nr:MULTISPECIES: tyrosinase cofactor [unclassified Kitasatospora]WSJ70252.1 tyrosinase cofactor [Kitasatospora sp. NBC_01302]
MSDKTSTTELTRRRMLQGAAVALTATAGTALLGLSKPAAKAAAADGGSATFDEVFQGRHIQGMPMSGGMAGMAGMHHGSGYMVLIDGQELHVMRNADGTWISVINHYQTFSTPRALARAAVNELQGATLTPIDL